MTLYAGAQIMHQCAPVELVEFFATVDGADSWWCKLLFVEPRIELRTFQRHALYLGLHGKQTFCANGTYRKVE